MLSLWRRGYLGPPISIRNLWSLQAFTDLRSISYGMKSRCKKHLKAVHRGWSIRQAAEEYDATRATLGDRVSGRVQPGAVSGPPKYLSTNEEKELVKFVLGCASIGYARSRKELIGMVDPRTAGFSSKVPCNRSNIGGNSVIPGTLL